MLLNLPSTAQSEASNVKAMVFQHWIQQASKQNPMNLSIGSNKQNNSNPMKFSIGSNMQATQSQNWIQRKSNEYSTCIQKKSNIAPILLQYCIQIGFTLIPT